MKHAIELLPFDGNVWTTKQMYVFCGCGEKMKLWNFRDSYVYPLCDAPEDNLHIIQCKSKTANDRWKSSIDALEEHLLDDDTPTKTTNMIVN